MAIVTSDEIGLCFDFAEYAWNNRSQSQRHFGGQSRSREAFIADQILGKLAEIVFKKDVENQFPHVQIELDFMHYMNPLHVDNGDVKIFVNGMLLDERIDIKGSSYRAQWLLVEDYKYYHPETGEGMSDKYVMVKLSDNVPSNPELRANPNRILDFDNIRGEIVGWVNHEEFISTEDNMPWFTYNRGERLINPRVLPRSMDRLSDLKHRDNYIRTVIRNNPTLNHYIGPTLDAEINYGLPLNWLYTNLNNLFI